MCGIAGLVAPAWTLEAAPVLAAMSRTLVHRGPDDAGVFETRSNDGAIDVGLAHRRLSIIDLDGGAQPMSSPDGTLTVVFNGEIYNFRTLRKALEARGAVFRTGSDTETLLHAYAAYGDDCVTHLSGMFAFALWDATRHRLFIARDRFGKKPLYFTRRGETFVFASEAKALLMCPGIDARVDEAAVSSYLVYRYVPGPRTLFEGIEKLPPGSRLVVENGAVSVDRWWRPPDGTPLAASPLPADPTGEFLARLDAAVAARLVSDVPFGAFLSGGLDSSAVVYLMQRHLASPVCTYAVGFAEARYSELDHARTVAREVGTDHHELVVDSNAMIDALPALVAARDAPVSEPSDIPIHLLAREASHSVKMVLTGEGADELLGGYPKHVFEGIGGVYRRLPRPLRDGLLRPLVDALPYRYRRAKTAIHALGLDDPHARMPAWFGSQIDARRCPLSALAPAGVDEAPFAATGVSALRQMLYFDQTSWLPDNLLERGDRMTMAASIEARMPFLDHELAAWVSTLPDRYRVRGRATKWILRQAMARHLPREILERPKVGFRVPVNEWFRGPMREMLVEHLSGTDCRTRAYYDQAVLSRVLGEHLAGRQNHEKLLWTLLNLEIWHRQYL